MSRWLVLSSKEPLDLLNGDDPRGSTWFDMDDPIVVLLAIIAVLLFAILLAVCAPCRELLVGTAKRFFREPVGCLVVSAIFLVPIAVVILLGVWAVRTYGFYEVLINVLAVAMVFGIPLAIMGLIMWIDGRLIEKRATAFWKKKLAQENSVSEKDKSAD